MEVATSTPTTSAPAAPAAVAMPTSGTTTTTSASSAPVERPKTFAEAFANDAALHTTDATTQPEAATTQPVVGEEAASAIQPSTDAKGPIPFEVHSKALDNARTKAVAEYREKYGWAEQVPRESLEKFSQIATSMTSDPISFINQFIAELGANPAHAAQLRSNAGRLLASARGPQADAEPQPDRQIVDEQGNVIGQTYADGGKARDAWLKRQVLAEVQQQFGPLKTERDQQIAEKRQAETTKQVEAKADEVMAEVMDILGGDPAFLADVSRVMDANPSWSAHKAALDVRKTKLDPASAGKAEAKVLESLKTKAAAQAINPAGAVVAASSRPKSFLDKSLKW